MLSISINHPDVEEFATAKQDETKVTGANISIRLTEEFMKAVENNEDYILRWPCDFSNTKWIDGLTRENGVGFDDQKFPKIYNELIPVYDTSGEDGGIVVYAKRVKAKELWNTIVTQARNTGDPGLMFWDNVIDYSPDGVYDEYKPVSSNP